MYALFVAAAALVALSDQVMKVLVRAKLTLGESLEVPLGLFSLTNVRNRGAGGGMFADNRRALLFFSAAAVLCEMHIFADLRQNFRNSKTAWLLFGLNVGGSISNLSDRLTKRYTTDYLHICPNKRSLVINIADIGILVGAVGLLIIYIKKQILN